MSGLPEAHQPTGDDRSQSGRDVPAKFNPDMLRLAHRGSQEWTQTLLAKAIRVSQGKVSKWEDGLLMPSDAEVEQLAAHLEYPVEFFYQQDSLYGFGTCCLYHRKRNTLPITVLSTIHDRVNVIRIGIARLLRNVEVMCENGFPPMDVDEYGNPEQIAQFLRALWKMPYGPVRNLVEVIESAGALVVPMSFGMDKLDAVSQWPRGMPPLFFVNRDSPADRWRFTLTHEVGHIIMHATTPSADAEREADRFAAEFLMPQKEITLDVKALTLSKALRLKPKWRVSAQAIIHRARDVGEITPRKYTSLFSYLSKLGYRKIEPNPISAERPTLLKRLIDAHLSDLKYTVDDLRKLVFCTEERFRRLYSEPEDESRFRIVR